MKSPPRTPPAAESGKLGEFEIVERFFAPLAGSKAALGLKDDAAIFEAPAGEALVVTCDALIEGVHFLPDDPPDSISHKALAVNLSDLAAKGARPFAYLLSLSLPASPDAAWLRGFADGLQALQEQAGASLIGGDTTATPGPVTIVVTALGSVPKGRGVLRRGAEPGDGIFVSGSIGDAALGLMLLRQPALAERWNLSESDREHLVRRYRRPEARTHLADAILEHAHAAIDLSDGLVGDIEKLCGQSQIAATIDAARVPLSPGAQKAVAAEPDLLAVLLTAGDDYELAAAVPPNRTEAFEVGAKAAGIAVTGIGAVIEGEGKVALLGPEGEEIVLPAKGFAHF